MKLAFTTACVFPDESRIWMLRQSADKLGIPLRPYGMGEDVSFRGWLDIKVHRWTKWAHGALDNGYTHCCYSDGRDSFFLAGSDEIQQKYRSLGSPPYLIATEDRCYPFPEHWGAFPDPGHPWRWLGAGQFICDLAWGVEMWRKLEERYRGMQHECHDQGWLMQGWVDGVLDRGEFVLDTECAVFQSARAEHFEGGQLAIRGGRIHNIVTESEPCAVHWPGGFSSPETGKDETLRPYWEAIYGQS